MNDYKIISKVLDVPLRTEMGLELMMGSYVTKKRDKTEHALIYKGNIQNPSEPILLRINSACYTSDIFGCQRCDCNWQLKKSIYMIHEKGGLIIYHFHHEGRGIGFTNKLRTYLVMDKQHTTTSDAFEQLGFNPDYREFLSSVAILKDLEIESVRLLTNNPKKKEILINNEIDVIEMIPLINKQEHLQDYLISKKHQFQHNMGIGKI